MQIMNASFDRRVKGFDTVATAAYAKFSPAQIVEGLIPFAYSGQSHMADISPNVIQRS
jgi:hypothetical protein